jgi:hypothetical protein
VAKYYDFLFFIEPFNEFAGKYGFACPGRGFKDKSAVLLYDRWKIIYDFLLPIS